MAKLGDIEVRIDPFFINTRVAKCIEQRCLNQDSLTSDCGKKRIVIGANARCMDFNDKKLLYGEDRD